MDHSILVLFIILALVFIGLATLLQGFGVALILIAFFIYMDYKENKKNK